MNQGGVERSRIGYLGDKRMRRPSTESHVSEILNGSLLNTNTEDGLLRPSLNHYLLVSGLTLSKFLRPPFLSPEQTSLLLDTDQLVDWVNTRMDRYEVKRKLILQLNSTISFYTVSFNWYLFCLNVQKGPTG